MLEGLILLQSFGFYSGGGAIGDLLQSWADAGFFTYVLPFLLIFAIVYGILNKMKIFGDEKGVNTIIALAVGFMALQFELVPQFFAEVFPRLGIGLSIILLILIFLGMFIEHNSKLINLLLAVGGVIVITVVYQSFAATGWDIGFFEGNSFAPLILLVVIIIAISAIVADKDPEKKDHSSILGAALKKASG